MKTLLIMKAFSRLYNVDKIDSDSLVKAILDVVVCRATLSLNQCCGQCYDGASNMPESKNGVAR